MRRRRSRGSSRSTAGRRCRRAAQSKTGSAAVAAGGRRPDWWSSAARPSVFSATVLPPVFGPLITSARRPSRSRSIGTAVARSSSGWRAPSSRTSSATSPPRRASPARAAPQASARSSAPAASTSAASGLGARADRRRELAQDPLDLLALRGDRLRAAVVQLDDLERLDEERLPEPETSWTMPRARSAARSPSAASTGRPAALGDEVLLQVVAAAQRSARRAAAPRPRAGGPSAAPCAAAAAPARRRRAGRCRPPRRSARSRRRARASAGIDRLRELAQERRGVRRLVERRARTERRPRSRPRPPQLRRAEGAAARGERRRPRGRPGAPRAAAPPSARSARSPPPSAPAAAAPPRGVAGVSARRLLAVPSPSLPRALEDRRSCVSRAVAPFWCRGAPRASLPVEPGRGDARTRRTP